jgi:uncharacterized protein (TIGR03084 family)
MLLQQVVDLREEGEELFELLKTLKVGDWDRHTPFKNWTVNDVVAHLHVSDWLAVLSVKDTDGFLRLAQELAEALLGGVDMRTFANERLGDLRGPKLLQQWREAFLDMCERLGELDPDTRLKWFGPDMGVRMFTTARQMETWAHGQDIYDLLNVERKHTDRIKNIAVIGVKTFKWTFMNRGLQVPGPIPYVRLTAPSGAIWEWNEPNEQNRIEGSAVEFCHVVTQGRNIADVSLSVVGDTARQWMAIAQCFAGGPEDPPKPGERVPK